MGRLLPILLALLVLARIALAATLAPGRDELAYWYWAWHGPDASYSLTTVGLLRLSTSLLGDGAFAMRLPTLLAGVAAIGLVVVAARRLGAGRDLAWCAGLALAASPWHLYTSGVVHPDVHLTFFALAFAIAALPAPVGSPVGSLAWRRAAPFAIAAAASLAALSKLPGALLLPVATWLLFRRSQPGARAAIALLALPIYILLRDLDPGILAGARAFGRFDPDVGFGERTGWTLLEIGLDAGPGLAFAAALGAWALGHRAARAAWPAWIAAGILFLFFCGSFLGGQAKGNWYLPSLALLVPLGAASLERNGVRKHVAPGAPRDAAFRRATLAGAVLAAAAAPIATNPEPLLAALAASPAIDATYARRAGARESTVAAARTWSGRIREYHRPPAADPRVAQAFAAGAVAVASEDYGVAFAQARALGRHIRVLLPWDPIFARDCGASPNRDEDVVFVSARLAEPPAEWRFCFDACRPLPAPAGAPGGEAGAAASYLHVVLCQGWNGPVTLAAAPASRREPAHPGEP